MIQILRKRIDGFKGGQIARFENEWKQLTNDNQILSWVRGVKIEFDSDLDELPALSSLHETIQFTEKECSIISKEINTLEKRGIVSECEHTTGEVISTVFLREKKDGTWRMILNLKRLNTQVTYCHFKMEHLTTALKLIKKDSFMASIDLEDAYIFQFQCMTYIKHFLDSNGKESYLNSMQYQMDWH